MDGRSRGWRLIIGCLVLAAAGCETESSLSHGRHLVHAHDLEPEVLERFASFNAKPKSQPGVVVRTEEWKGDVLRTSSQANPYRIVVTIRGVAQRRGDVAARVDSGWALGDGVTRILPTPHVRSKDAQPGDRIELVSVSAPVSFEDDRDVVPTIGYAGSTNLHVDGMSVEVWSGLGRPGWLESLRSITLLLTGLAILSLAIWWRSR